MGFYIVTVVMFLTTIALVKVNFNDLGVLALCSLVVFFQHKFLIKKLSKIYRMVKSKIRTCDIAVNIHSYKQNENK